VPSCLIFLLEKSAIAAVSFGAASTAQRSPPSHAAPVTSESCVETVSPLVESSTTGASGRVSPQAPRSAADTINRNGCVIDTLRNLTGEQQAKRRTHE
jgi:hypothetical protein